MLVASYGAAPAKRVSPDGASWQDGTLFLHVGLRDSEEAALVLVVCSVNKHRSDWWCRARHTCNSTPAESKEEPCMARLPDIESEQSKVTTVLRAMSNAKRMRILNELSDGRERSVSELESVIASLSQSALSQHLARLRRANIVRTRRESQTIFYSIDDADVLRILRLLSHIYNDDPVMKRTTH
jgi:DNA-binding transcriptional ArsR family regulator